MVSLKQEEPHPDALLLCLGTCDKHWRQGQWWSHERPGNCLAISTWLYKWPWTSGLGIGAGGRTGLKEEVWGRIQESAIWVQAFSLEIVMCFFFSKIRTTSSVDTKSRPRYMLSTRDPPQNKGCIQTESEGLERYFTQMEIKRKQE